MTAAAGLEVIEALIWQTGTRDQFLVTRILRAVDDYARAADCPPGILDRRRVLDQAVPDRRGGDQRQLPDVPGLVRLDPGAQLTLAEVLGITDDIDSPPPPTDWRPR